MGSEGFFGRINSFLDEKYTAFSEFLTDKGIPFDRYNTFLESHGIPPMWFNIFLIILIIVVIVLLTFLVFNTSVILHLSFSDVGANKLGGPIFLNLKLDDESVFSQSVNAGEIIINEVNVGDVLSVSAKYSDYELISPSQITISEKEMSQEFIFKKIENKGSVQIRLFDAETQTSVSGAQIKILDGENILFEGTTDEEGVVNVSDLTLAKPLKVSVIAEGYNDAETTELFSSGATKELSLEPKPIALGEQGTITFKVTSNGETIGDVKISVYNFETKNLISEEITDAEGTALVTVPQGIVLRYVASKEGFMKEDSAENNKNITLREKTKTVNVYLDVGGTSLTVSVEDESKIAVSGAIVALYSQNGLILDSNTTDVFGNIEFFGINVKAGGFVSVFSQGYYPTSVQVNPLLQTELTIQLKKIDLKSSARLQIFVTDKANKPVSNAGVEIFLVGDKELPLFLPDAKTSITGLYLAQLEPDKTYDVRASTEELTASKTITSVSGDNKVELVLLPKQKISTLYVYGVDGSLLQNAKTTIKTETTNLFDGITDEKGTIVFTPGSAKSVEVTVIALDSTVYTKIVDVAEKMELHLQKLDISKEPKISFIGIYDSIGNKLNGVKVNETYYLKFSVVWPKAQKTGEVHVRLGEDNVPAVSMDYSIIGADSISAVQKEFGLFYSPNATTSTVNDLTVFGKPGIKNKWVNLYYNNPIGNTEFKVKMKVENAKDLQQVQLHYRSISFDGNKYYLDNPTTLDLSSKFKRLYAPTNDETLNVFKDLFECSQILCYSYSFVDEYTKYSLFTPIVGQIYGLDLELYGLDDVSGVLEFSSLSLLKNSYLNNIDDGNLESFVPKDLENYSLNYSLALQKGETKKIRLYFTAAKVGNSSIALKSGPLSLNKTLDFIIAGQKNMSVSLSSNGIIEFGKPIVFTVQDNSGKVKDAVVRVSGEKGLINIFVKGDATGGKGKDGKYIITDLSGGIYNYEVRSPGHITITGNFVVTKFGIFDVKPEIEVAIPKGQTKRVYEFEVKNISAFSLTNLGFEVLRDDAKAFNISYKFVKTNLLAGNTTKIVVTAETNAQDVVYGDQDILLSATIDTKEVVRQKVHLTFIANTDLDNSCLVVTPPELSVVMYDTQNKTYNGTLTLENKCEFEMVLNPQFVEASSGLPINALRFSGTSLSLKPGNIKNMQFTLNNTALVPSQGFFGEFFINLDTAYFRKQIPTKVQVVKGFGALALSTVQHLFLTGNQPMSVPLILQNLGNVPIRQVTIMIQPYNNTPFTMDIPYDDTVASEYYNPLLNGPPTRPLYDSQGTYMQSLNPMNQWSPQGVAMNATSFVGNFIQPVPRIIPQVFPGQSGAVMLYAKTPSPQKSNLALAYTIVAQGYSQSDNAPVVAYTPLFVSISSQKCLHALAPSNEITIMSGKLGSYVENENLSIINECAEPVALQLPAKDTVKGTNTTLEVGTEEIVLDPKQTVNVKSVLFANDEMDTAFSVNLKGVGTETQKQYDLTVLYKIRTGKAIAGNGGAGALAFAEKEIKECDSEKVTKTIFPKTNGVDCETSYCDGQKATEYLLAKIKSFVSEYDNKSSKYAATLQSTNCDVAKGSCDFQKIGLVNPTFTMYLMNDRISDTYLQELINSSQKLHLKSVAVLPTKDYDVEAQSEILLNKLYVDSAFEKCGKYTVQLQGAFQIVSGSMQRESYNVFVKTDFEKTKECEPKVSSASLFLPFDNKATKDSVYGFMMGFVDSDKTVSGLDALAKELSKKLFNQERTDAGKPNTLYLARGTLKGKMFDIEMKNEGSNVTTIITINNELDLTNASIKNDLFNAISSFLQGNFIGCMKDDGKKASVESAGEVKEGAYKLTSCTPVNVNYGTETCEFTVYGPGAGLASLFLNNEKTNGYTAKIIDQSGSSAENITFYSGKPQKYKVELNFTDPVSAITSAKDSPLKIILRPNSGEDLTGDVPFTACGVDPVTFVSGVVNSGLKASEYYAQTNWSGPPESKDGCDVFKEVQAKTKASFLSGKTQSGQVCSGSNVKALTNEINTNFWKATGAAGATGFAACMASEAVLGKMKFLGPFGWGAATFTCGIITADLVGTSVYANHRANVATGLSSLNTLDGIHDWMASDWYTGGFLLDDYSQGVPEDNSQGQGLSDTGAGALGAATKLRIKGPGGIKETFFTPVELDTVSQFNDDLVEAMKEPIQTELLKETEGDPKKLFESLAKDNPKFKSSYNKFLTLAKEKGFENNPEELFKEGLSKKQTLVFNEMQGAIKDAASVDKKIAELETKKGVLEKEFDDLVKSGKNLVEVNTKLNNVESELDTLKLNAEAASKSLDEGMSAVEKDLKPSKLGKNISKGWNFTKGLIKGAASAIAANEAYKAMWMYVMGNSMQINSFAITLPDKFVKYNSYEFSVIAKSKSEYLGEITETDTQHTINFCKADNLQRGFIEDGVLLAPDEPEGGPISPEDVTKLPKECSAYADLFRKYGEVLSQITNGGMDGKDIIAQMSNESGYNPVAKSKTNALGLGQFIQSTFCGITKELANNQHADFTSKFNNNILKQYGASTWSEFNAKTCAPLLTQCNGGILIPTSDKCSYDVAKDPRTNPELAVMYTAILEAKNFKAEGSKRAAIEAYVVGGACILGDGKYNYSGKCATNIKNNPVDKGNYWAKYQKRYAAADTCLNAEGTVPSQTPSAQTMQKKIKIEGPVLFVGDSITVGKYYNYWKNVAGKNAQCGVVSGRAKHILKYLESNCSLTDAEICGEKNGKAICDGSNSEFSGKFEDYETVVVLAGINNIASGDAADTTKKELQQIYDFFGKKSIDVLALTVMPICTSSFASNTNSQQDKLKAINAWIKTKPTSVVSVVDTYDYFLSGNIGNKKYYASDCIHLNAEGKQLASSLLAQQVDVS